MKVLKLENIPEQIKCVLIESRYAFATSVIIGILVHIYPLTHRFFNEDYHYAYMPNLLSQIKVGRWFTAFFNSYSDGYVIPSLSMLIAVFFYALTVVLLVRAFKINNKVSVFFFAGIIMTFPALASAVSYMMTLQIGATVIFLSVLSFYMANKSRKLAFAGAIPLCLSLGGYQGYIALPVTLCIISLIMIILKEESTLKELMNKALDFLVLGILGAVLYLIVTKLLLLYYDFQMSEYAGFDNMGRIAIESVPYLIVSTYKGYVSYLIGTKFLYAGSLMKVINLLFVTFDIFLLGYFAFKAKIVRKPAKIVLLIVLVVMLPFAVNIIDFLSNNGNTLLGIYAVVFTYLLPFILLRQNKPTQDRLKIPVLKISSWVANIGILLVIFNFITISNIFYHKLDIAYNNTVAFVNRMIMNIDETEGFSYDIPIAFAGTLTESDFYENSFLFNYRETMFMRGLWGQYVGMSKETDVQKFVNLCNNYFGSRYKVSKADLDQIKLTDEYLNMNTYPKSNSIKIIDGALIIKLSYSQQINVKKEDTNTYTFNFSTDNKTFDSSKYTYAWYVLKNNSPIYKGSYQNENLMTYRFDESGNYSVKVFVRNKDTNTIELTRVSDKINIE